MFHSGGTGPRPAFAEHSADRKAREMSTANLLVGLARPPRRGEDALSSGELTDRHELIPLGEADGYLLPVPSEGVLECLSWTALRHERTVPQACRDDMGHRAREVLRLKTGEAPASGPADRTGFWEGWRSLPSPKNGNGSRVQIGSSLGAQDRSFLAKHQGRPGLVAGMAVGRAATFERVAHSQASPCAPRGTPIARLGAMVEAMQPASMNDGSF